MECNKDEAIRAKDIAERKFTEKDYAGAKKFALKAQALYPSLDGISQMITTFEVYISSESKINGEMDMYGILGVNPLDDDETIKKQYRKLVLMLHPDKNKSVGADGAFQLAKEAYNLLSDKAKRSAFNIRRNIRAVQQQRSVPTQNGGVSTATPSSVREEVGLKVPDSKIPQKPNKNSAGIPVANGYSNHSGNNSASGGKPKKTSTKKSSCSSDGGVFKSEATFWTVCTNCKLQYEYVRVYLNRNLKCQICESAFLAVEVPPPLCLSANGYLRNQNSNFSSRPNLFNGSVSSSSNVLGARWSPFFGTTIYSSTSSGCNPTQPTSASQTMNEIMKRKHEEGQPHSTSVLQGERPLKRTRVDETVPRQNGMGKGNLFTGFSLKNNTTRELSAGEMRKVLANKALVLIKEKLKEWSDAKEKAKHAEKTEVEKNNGVSSENQKGGEDAEMEEAITVPDPDFHFFDSDRSESCFGENQVWSTYDNDDGMPRFYALIHEVISLAPFKLKISWLNSKTNTEFSSSLRWVDRGFAKTCGEFRVGKHETYALLNSFSRKLKWVKGPRGVIQIYPQKGEVWALYKNWSPNWDNQTPDEIRHVYEMAEILDDYDNKHGVSVAPLVKAPGFRTVFRKLEEVKHIPKQEMFRFSHQVPSHVLTGDEKPNAPVGYIELDPAATPLSLLQDIENGTHTN